MTTESPTDLACRSCGASYEAGPDEPWRCSCGHALDFAEMPVPDGSPPPFSKLDTRRGLWTFFEFLPMEQRVSLGEGFTPLVHADDWNAQFKLEYVFPTGSFKDRGATTTLSRAAELGVEKVIEDSSGNAGAAIATYAARAGIDADIYVPADVKQSKLMAIQRSGARPIRVEGTRADVTEACIEAVEAGEGWYASHAWNPAFFAGTMTFAFEVAAQREWSVPEAVVLPVGHGTLLLGAYRGFAALQAAGITDEMPRLLGAQAAGYAPIADALETPETPTDEEKPTGPQTAASTAEIKSMLGSDGERADDPGPNEIADGIQITQPAREEQLVEAIKATDGAAIARGETAVARALDELHRAGFYVEPTCATAVAALDAYRDRGVLAPDADVVLPLTGSGLKTM